MGRNQPNVYHLYVLKYLWVAFLGSWLSFSVSGSSALAYYHVPGTPEATFECAKQQGQSPSTADAFAVYDHRATSSSDTESPPCLQSPSSQFVPADTISANPPIHLAPRRPILADNELTNLFYANLKFKRLVDEYGSLQQRARKLMGDLNRPAVNPVSGFGDKKQQPVSIHQQRLGLSKQQQLVARTLLLRSQRNDSQSVAQAPVMAQIDRSRVPDRSSLSVVPGNAPGYLSDYANSEQGRRPVSGSHSDTSLPWIFEFALKVMAYMLANKVEAIVYGVLAMSVLILLSGLRSR